MANNYHPATMSPTNLRLSEMHQVFLEAVCADLDENSDGTFYVYWSEGFSDNAPDDYDLKEAVSQKRITSDEAGFLANSTFYEMLRHILIQNPEHSHIRIEGAYYCTKMRPDEFGGQAMVVTRTHYAWMGTTDLHVGEDGKIKADIKIEEFK